MNDTEDYWALASGTWWDTVKDSKAWSGALQGIPWADLWPEAKEQLTAIYYQSQAL